MALDGELGVAEMCPDCGTLLPVVVCRSGAGYYIGQHCSQCGPYNRLSYYYPTRADAAKALKNNSWARRDTRYQDVGGQDNGEEPFQ